jgi:hypothetical protein
MRTSNRIVAALGCALAANFVACSDALAPRDEAQRLAVHFDSLWADASSHSSGNAGLAVRATALTLIETPLALGANPTSFSVITSTGAERWHAVMIGLSPAEAFDQPFSLYAYRDDDAHTLLLASIRSDGHVDATLIANDSIPVFASRASGDASALTPGRGCASISGLRNPDVLQPNASTFTCTVGRFTARFTLDFPSHSGVDSALTNISFGETTFNGVQLTRIDAASQP